MPTAILGKKIGMTHVFDQAGAFVSVTAITAGPCPVLAVREKSLQIAFDPVDEKRLKKPVAGYFKKLNIAPHKLIKEVIKDGALEYKVAGVLKADMFKPGDYVDVIGTTKGKGFQGGMKRWKWSGGPQTHGSMSHRRVGSIGSSTTPGRVWKGHHLPGHMGNSGATLQNLLVVKADPENNLLLVRGAVPGNKNSYLVIRTAKKKKAKAAAAVKPAAKSKGK